MVHLDTVDQHQVKCVLQVFLGPAAEFRDKHILRRPARKPGLVRRIIFSECRMFVGISYIQSINPDSLHEPAERLEQRIRKRLDRHRGIDKSDLADDNQVDGEMFRIRAFGLKAYVFHPARIEFAIQDKRGHPPRPVVFFADKIVVVAAIFFDRVEGPHMPYGIPLSIQRRAHPKKLQDRSFLHAGIRIERQRVRAPGMEAKHRARRKVRRHRIAHGRIVREKGVGTHERRLQDWLRPGRPRNSRATPPNPQELSN